MPELQPSGMMSNLYAYEPIDRVQEGPASTILGNVGTIIGASVAQYYKVGPTAENALTNAASFSGSALGEFIDNQQEIVSNVQTFVSEINDWRSWEGLRLGFGGIPREW